MILFMMFSHTFAAETADERIARRIDFLKAYIQNQDKILALSENIPQDYLEAQKAVTQYQGPAGTDLESMAIHELSTATLFYQASIAGLTLAAEFYQQVDLCNKVNDRYQQYRPLEKFNADPGKMCEFDEVERAKYPTFDIKLFCLNNNYLCDSAVVKFKEMRSSASAAAKKITERVPDDSFMSLLSAFSADWIDLSLHGFHYHCHPQYPKCTDDKCKFYKWPIQITQDHDNACLKITELADKHNILLKDTKKVYAVAQPYHPLIFNSQKRANSESYTLENRFLSLIIKHQPEGKYTGKLKEVDYYFYSPLIRGANWLAMAETLFEKNRKVLEELEKKQSGHPVVKEFRKVRIRAFDKKISTQETLDRARFHFTIDDYVKNF